MAGEENWREETTENPWRSPRHLYESGVTRFSGFFRAAPPGVPPCIQGPPLMPRH